MRRCWLAGPLLLARSWCLILENRRISRRRRPLSLPRGLPDKLLDKIVGRALELAPDKALGKLLELARLKRPMLGPSCRRPDLRLRPTCRT